MASSLPTILAMMHDRILRIGKRQEELKNQLARADKEIEDLKAELERVKTERDKALNDAEFLKYSYRLANSPDTIIQTRRHIAGLIRNIDRCIRMLKE